MGMADDHQKIDAALADVEAERRTALRRLVIKGAFVTPVVASFAMSALTVDKAAAAGNTTSSKQLP